MHVSDALAFSLVTLWARKTKTRCIHFTTILDTIAEDATWYFMVIFSSHFVLVMTLNLGRVSVTVSLTRCNELHPLDVSLGDNPTSSRLVSHLRRLS